MQHKNKASCVLAVDPILNQYICLYNEENGHNLPGGKVEPGETFVEAAVREFREETGIEIQKGDLIPLHSGSDAKTWERVGTFWVVTYLVFLGEYKLNSPEGLDLSLKPMESLLKSVWLSYNKELLQNYYKFRSHLDVSTKGKSIT